MQIKATAPGSLMLLGEYAVLYGKHALVCAVDKRISVTLTPRSDGKIEIESSLHGHHSTDLYHLHVVKPFHYILAALKHYQPHLKRGCTLEITTEFSDKIGLGSSAAVTVATLAAIITWLNIRTSPHELIRQGRNVVRQVQTVGSGADIAASVLGGMVSYLAQPLAAEKLLHTCPLTVLYAGFKTPTVTAIKQVQDYFTTHPQVFRHLSNGIGQCAFDGTQYASKGDWARLGEIMNIQQGLMESLGVSLPVLREMITDLRAQTGIHGAKISGSGLGDCVVGLGNVDQYVYQGAHPGVTRIPVEITMQGVWCDKS